MMDKENALISKNNQEVIYFVWNSNREIIQTLLIVEKYHKKSQIIIIYTDRHDNINMINFNYLENSLGFTLIKDKDFNPDKFPKPTHIYFFIIGSEIIESIYQYYENMSEVIFNIVDEGLASYTYISNIFHAFKFYLNKNASDIFNWKRFDTMYLYNPELSEDKHVFNIKALDKSIIRNSSFIDKLNFYYKFDATRFNFNNYSAFFIDQYLSYDFQSGMHINIEAFFISQLNHLMDNKLIVKIHPTDTNGYKYENLGVSILADNTPFELIYLNLLNKTINSTIYIISHYSSVILNLITIFKDNPNIKYIYTYKLVNQYLKKEINATVIETYKNNNPDVPLYIPSTIEELAKTVGNNKFNYEKFKYEERTVLLNSLKEEAISENNHVKTSIAYLKNNKGEYYDEDYNSYYMYSNKVKISYAYKNNGIYYSLIYFPCYGALAEIEELEINITNNDTGEHILIKNEQIEVLSGEKVEGKIVLSKRNARIKINLIPSPIINGRIEFKYKLKIDRVSYIVPWNNISQWDYPSLSNIWLDPVKLEKKVTLIRQELENTKKELSYERIKLSSKFIRFIKRNIKKYFTKRNG